MKFKIVSESKRTLERVFDAGLILVFTGILLQRDVREDFYFFGTMLLITQPDLRIVIHDSGFSDILFEVSHLLHNKIEATHLPKGNSLCLRVRFFGSGVLLPRIHYTQSRLLVVKAYMFFSFTRRNI